MQGQTLAYFVKTSPTKSATLRLGISVTALAVNS